MSLASVAERCAVETTRYVAQKSYETRYCFELFRRAIVEKQQAAWDCLYTQYSGLVASWAEAHPAFVSTGEEIQYFVNRAFEYFVKAFQDPARFDRFPTLSTILEYLKACCRSAVRDERRKLGDVPVDLPVVVQQENEPDVLHSVITTQQRVAVRHLINSRLQSDSEHIVLKFYFELGLKPREIFSLHRDIFQDVQAVYRTKRNLLERLSRDPELQQLWRDAPEFFT